MTYLGYANTITVNDNDVVFAAIKTGASQGPRIIKIDTNGQLLFNSNLITNIESEKRGFYYAIYADANENIILSGMHDEFKHLVISIKPSDTDFVIQNVRQYTYDATQPYIYTYPLCIMN